MAHEGVAAAEGADATRIAPTTGAGIDARLLRVRRVRHDRDRSSPARGLGPFVLIEVEHHGEKRAGYGDEVIERLAQRLAGSVGQGFGARTLRRIRQFYVTFPEGSALPPELGGPAGRTAAPSKSKPEKIRTAALTQSAGVPAPFPPHLGWTHYLVPLRVTNPTARAFYEIEAARESWPSRELERQIALLLFERLAKSRNKENVLALARRGHEIEAPADVLEDPFVLEFLGLDERSHWREREAAERALRLATSVNGDDKGSESSR